MQNTTGKNSTGLQTPYNKPSNIVLLMSVWAVLFLISLVGNSLVCAVVIRLKTMRSETNVLLVNLAIADLLLAFCTPLAVVDFTNNKLDVGSVGCKLQVYKLDVFYAASTFTLISVALERYYAVCRPLQFQRLRKHLRLTIFFIWFSSCLVYSPMLWACTVKVVAEKSQLSCNCHSRWPKWYHYTIYAMCIVTVLYILPLTVMLRCYIPVIRTLWRPSVVGSDSMVRERQKKIVVKTLIVVVISFFVLWTPYNILYVLKKFQVDFQSVYSFVWYGALFLGFISNCINPIIYTLMNRSFRNAVRTMCSKRDKRKQNEQFKERKNVDLSSGNQGPASGKTEPPTNEGSSRDTSSTQATAF